MVPPPVMFPPPPPPPAVLRQFPPSIQKSTCDVVFPVKFPVPITFKVFCGVVVLMPVLPLFNIIIISPSVSSLLEIIKGITEPLPSILTSNLASGEVSPIP